MNLKTGISILFMFFIVNLSYSQYVTLVSNNSTGVEYILDLIQHTNSFIYSAGVKDPGPLGSSDCIISKLDTNNNLIWSKVYGDTNYNSTVEIKELSDSNILLIGYYVNYPTNYFSSMLCKLDQNGDTLWTQTIYDSTKHIALHYLDNSNDTIKLFGEYGNKVIKGILVAISASTGELFWSKSYFIQNNLSTHFYSAKTRKANNKSYILTKTVTDSITLSEKEFLCTFDQYGSPMNVLEIADSATSNITFVNISEQTGKVLIGMNNHRGNGFGDNYLVCLIDSTGNLIYAKEFGPGFGITIFTDGIIIDSTNSVLLAAAQSIIYHLDSIGGIKSIRKIYFDPLFPFSIIGLNKVIVYADMLIGGGGIRHTNNPPINMLFTKSKLDGTGCQNISITGNNVNVPVSLASGTMIVDTITTLHTISTINYFPINLIFNIACISNVNIQENKNRNEILLYPNPVFENLTFKGNWNYNNCEIQIYDNLGRVVFNKQMVLTRAENTISLKHLKPAIYLISISDNEGNLITKRFIKD